VSDWLPVPGFDRAALWKLRWFIVVVLLAAVASCTVTSVTPSLGPVASISVSPASTSVAVGQTVWLSAMLYDAGGNVLSGLVVTWSSNNPAVASVSSSGLVTGMTTGATTITATSGGQSGSAAVSVPALVASVSVSPATMSVTAGQTVQLTATPQDANGNPLTGRTILWLSSNPAIATVTGSGLVTGMGAGMATITATSEGQTGSAVVNIAQPQAALDEIKVTYSGSTPGLTWVLLRGQTVGACEKPPPKTASVPDFQVANMWTLAACPSEVAVFGSGYAPVLDVIALTLGVDVVTETPGGPLPLELNLWVVTDAPGTDEFWKTMKAIFVETQTLLDTNRVGVELRLPLDDGTFQNLANWTQFPTSRLVRVASPEGQAIGNSCASKSTVKAAGPSLYDPNRLNLYVVDVYAGSQYEYEMLCNPDVYKPPYTNTSCPAPDNVIYLSRLYHMNASLAHVLGHAFSLLGCGIGHNADGHTGSTTTTWIAGFTSTNIMWFGLDWTTPARQFTFSLGQVYRMALAADSRLNQIGLRGAGAATKVCPDDPTLDDPCPPLALPW
jgi:Big-like domain-containing protein